MMQVSLRKAAKIRSRVASKLQEITQRLYRQQMFVTSVYDTDVLKQLNDREGEFITEFARYRAISSEYSNLRGIIALANSDSGVSSLLAELNGLEAVLGTIHGLVVNLVPRMTPENIQARLAGAQERAKVAASMVGENVNFDYLTEQNLEAFKKLERELQAQISNLHDKMEEINISFSVELSDGMVSLFTMEDIL